MEALRRAEGLTIGSRSYRPEPVLGLGSGHYNGILHQMVSSKPKATVIQGLLEGLHERCLALEEGAPADYIPELALAAAWTIPAGFTHLLPWFYWIFLTILLFDRAGRDDKRCSAKYGDAYQEYKKRVPYRIVPYVY